MTGDISNNSNDNSNPNNISPLKNSMAGDILNNPNVNLDN